MLKYILLSCLIVLLVLNFTVGKLMGFVTKKEISEKTEMTAKIIIYAVALALAIVIMIFC